MKWECYRISVKFSTVVITGFAKLLNQWYSLNQHYLCESFWTPLPTPCEEVLALFTIKGRNQFIPDVSEVSRWVVRGAWRGKVIVTRNFCRLGWWESSNYICLCHECNFSQCSSGRHMTKFKFKVGVTCLQRPSGWVWKGHKSYIQKRRKLKHRIYFLKWHSDFCYHLSAFENWAVSFFFLILYDVYKVFQFYCSKTKSKWKILFFWGKCGAIVIFRKF